MVMGRWKAERQGALFVEVEELVRSEGRTFFTVLSELLAEHGFDGFCEDQVVKAGVFAKSVGRPSVAPGVYFRMLLVGYFEGLCSERAIAWRCGDSLTLREFLGYELSERTPDHSTLSGLRRKLGDQLHRDVFDWVLRVAQKEGVLKGRRVAVDSTTLQANASMKNIVRRCDGVSYQKYLAKLAKAEGIAEPTKEDLQRLDRKRKGKKLSNRQWKSRSDKQARIAKMKNGSTRMAYKAENAVDVESGVIVAAEVHGADKGDTSTLKQTALKADEAVMKAGIEGGIVDLIGDRGYHADAALADLQTIGFRTFIAERPVPAKRNWKQVARRHGKEKMERFRKAFHRNRRRQCSATGRALQKKRAEYPERSFAHICNTGGLRRVTVRGRSNVLKRLQLHAAASNLAKVIRAKLGFGTPRSLQGHLAAILALLLALYFAFRDLARRHIAYRAFFCRQSQRFGGTLPHNLRPVPFMRYQAFSTGC